MKSKPVELIFFFLFVWSQCVQSQNENSESKITVRKGNKTFAFEHNDRIYIRQVTARTGDNYILIIKADSLFKIGDTLIVRPWRVLQRKYVDGKRSPSFAWPADNRLKIPVHEIKKISIKRQPLCFILTSFATFSYIGAFAAIAVIPPNSDAQINKRTNIALSCYAVFIPSFTVRLLLGKKHLRFNGEKSGSKTWTF